jgi:hypothetical protein
MTWQDLYFACPYQDIQHDQQQHHCLGPPVREPGNANQPEMAESHRREAADDPWFAARSPLEERREGQRGDRID